MIQRHSSQGCLALVFNKWQPLLWLLGLPSLKWHCKLGLSPSHSHSRRREGSAPPDAHTARRGQEEVAALGRPPHCRHRSLRPAQVRCVLGSRSEGPAAARRALIRPLSSGPAGLQRASRGAPPARLSLISTPRGCAALHRGLRGPCTGGRRGQERGGRRKCARGPLGEPRPSAAGPRSLGLGGRPPFRRAPEAKTKPNQTGGADAAWRRGAGPYVPGGGAPTRPPRNSRGSER
ncbi:uncharacterized protein LOC116667549 [Camelus ferus]|uniref:Uncharacterized protein LOC116667549 n=1 Tax=Camelus ferus TaxID=419612 RepID=A0A8B8U2A2_CAMFR|nr:uncharacterized protein LOC116667549 [Camelus ferus]